MNKYELFISKLPNVNNENELCDIICDLGMFNDNRCIYGKYEKYQVHQGGVWQDPYELATFLWNSQDDFKGAKSFLEIGTFTGYSFFIIFQFLKVFVNKDIIGKTVDPSDSFIVSDISPYISPYYFKGTSFDVINETFDIVFIDGCHENPWPINDFENVGQKANIVFFHDINDKYCHDVVTTFNKLEKKMKSKRYHHACVPNTFGIGIVFPAILK